ncbi:MAG: hypothetical protein COV34_02830 [Candidatus Zambryskibacteria bacterium CG10_big_fil_rev_8_21_14_0_10_42_12]|uniref:DUF2177 domain-containing protein n=1 Tax=Candidatus Zambryskibacteria bacterium CG10_big_fil_rev_8_21_14_0_10_42_12 TaxID=1975115 RepID=A0A2H0QUR4_9BACT|nr:MAG: hypothetical protein COV34_02830 [Candidatus Zambryskibacteria bacterium CG10_big_fil_rev_8_21_14_0_10_42_12]
MYDYLIILASLLALDVLWLAYVMGDFYKKRLGHIMPEKINLALAIPFYLIFSFAILVFIIWPASIYSHSYLTVFLRGGLLGLAAYAAYDFTNHVTVRGWSWSLTAVDLLWGSCMTGLVALIATLL